MYFFTINVRLRNNVFEWDSFWKIILFFVFLDELAFLPINKSITLTAFSFTDLDLQVRPTLGNKDSIFQDKLSLSPTHAHAYPIVTPHDFSFPKKLIFCRSA